MCHVHDLAAAAAQKYERLRNLKYKKNGQASCQFNLAHELKEK